MQAQKSLSHDALSTGVALNCWTWGAEKPGPVRTQSVVNYPLGYSPDDKQLLFSAFGSKRINLVERPGTQIRHLAGEMPTAAVWLNTNSFVMHSETGLRRVVIHPSSFESKSLNLGEKILGIAAMSDGKIAILGESMLFTVELETGARHTLFSFSNQLSESQWLQYSLEKNEFLFCAWDDGNWRHLYRLQWSGQDWRLNQVTFDSEHTYNARWIQKGKGIAYICNHTNSFSLIVQPDDPTARTNLFVKGHIYGYTVSNDGEKLYAIASVDVEPLGVWEYNIRKKNLRRVTPATKFSATEFIPRSKHWAKSRDGIDIEYYTVPPRNLQKNKKYPVIIYIPVYGNQACKVWDAFSQFFGNIGVYHVAVNYRSSDGYGRKFSNQDDRLAFNDIIAVYDEITRDPTVDKSRVFLMGFCGAPKIANDSIVQYPDHWAGTISIRGIPPEQNPIVSQHMRVFYFIPDIEGFVSKSSIDEFENWMNERQVSGTVIDSSQLVGAKNARALGNTEIDRKTLVLLSQFIFN